MRALFSRCDMLPHPTFRGNPVPELQQRHVLSLNTGSSSVKFALYRLRDGEEDLRLQGAADRIGAGGGRLRLHGPEGELVHESETELPDAASAVQALLEALEDQPPLDATGHRVVHGGPDHRAPELVTRALRAELSRLVPFAPLHLPSALSAIDALASAQPDLPQVACFDTAFHRRMPELAQRFPLERALWDRGVRRYGFHGLSYEYVLHELGPAAQGRCVIAHLGNGASLAAVHDGQPLDTSMGFTPTGGVMMGTRSGDLDPGVLLYLLRELGWDASRIERAVDLEAGLLGVSGRSSDMRTLLEVRAHDPHAAEAVALFCYQVRKHVGALATVLGGLDLLVFTGGIGEHASPVRNEICRGLEHLGIRLDPGRERSDLLTEPDSPCTVRVVHTDEELMIARHTAKLVFGPREAGPG